MLILKCLLLITFLTSIVDLSIYLVVRGKEDNMSKQLPNSINITSPSNKTTPTTNINHIAKPLKNGVSVILLKDLRSNTIWEFNSKYRDSNSNNLMDINDVGYVTPGSTMKVLIAYCLYKGRTPNAKMESIIKRALIISDNDSANKMISWIGGVKKVQECFETIGLSNTYINRKFGSITSITSKGCKEGNTYSNCTTPETLVKVMEYLVTGNNTLGLYLPKDKRDKIVSILSLRPRNINVNKPNDYCAFLKERGPQKCGVALLDTSISNIAYIPDKHLIVFIGFRGEQLPDSQMSNVIQSIYNVGLNSVE